MALGAVLIGSITGIISFFAAAFIADMSYIASFGIYIATSLLVTALMIAKVCIGQTNDDEAFENAVASPVPIDKTLA